MKKYLVFLCVCSLLTACSENNNHIDENNTDVTTVNTEIEETSVNVEKNCLELTDYINDNQLGLSQIYCISDIKILISSYNKGKYDIQTIDTKSGDVSDVITCDTEPVCSENGFWVLRACDSGGMAVTNPIIGKYAAADMVLVYDYDFLKISEIKLESDWQIQGFDVDILGKNVYYSYNKMVESEEHHCLDKMSFSGDKENIIDVLYSFDHDNWLSTMYDIKFTPEQFIYLGCISPLADGSKPTVDGYGTLKVGSITPDYTWRSDTYNNKIEKFNGGALIHDGGMPLGVAPSGCIEYFNNGQQSHIELQNKFETPNIYVSQNGEYFTTLLKGKNEDETPIFRFTVYNKEGNVLKTEDCSFDSECTIPKVFMNEYTKSVYYEAVIDQETTWADFSF